MDDAATALLRAVFDKLGLSARAYDRIAAAAQFRSLDRKYWGTNG